MPPIQRPTLADVALAAGVSKMTASRALRHANDVSKSSVERVVRAARDIGYVGNHLATSLSSKRSNLIGVVVPSLTNIVFAEALSGIAEAITGSGLQPVFGVTDYDDDREYETIRNMLSWMPAGLIVTGLDQSPDTRRLLEGAAIPIVQMMDTDGEAVDACVGLSHHAAGAAMAQALLHQGRRKFGYIGCNLDRDTRAQKRFDGFAKTLLAAGQAFSACVIADGPSTLRAGRDMTHEIISQNPHLDSIYYSNDDVATGGAFHCIAHGITVPGQIMLAGFNGLDLIESLPIRIATTRTPRRHMGAAAAKLILDANQETLPTAPQYIEFPTEIDFGT